MWMAWIGIAQGATVDLGTRGVRGLAWHDGALWALDPNRGGSIRGPERTVALPEAVEAPRGLALHDGAAWVLDWRETASWLWRVDLATSEATSTSLAPVLGGGEALALAFDDDDLWLSWTGGLVRLDGGDLDRARHLPASGPTRGLAFGEVDGVRYLFTTTGEHVTVADRRTGRPVISVPAPPAKVPPWGVAVGDGQVWVGNRQPRPEGGWVAPLSRAKQPEGRCAGQPVGQPALEKARARCEPGDGGRADALALDTLDEPRVGPWRVRDVVLTVTTEPRRAPRGWVEHVYGGVAPLVSQQPVDRAVEALSRGAERHDRTWHAGDDPTFAQEETVLRWEGAHRRLESRAVLRARLREVERGIFPHRVTLEPPGGPGYDDDAAIFRLTRTATYSALVDRVVAWVSDRYGLTEAEARAELDHPYWAARDVTEYIFATYLYPSKEVRPTRDEARGHFHSSPADLKAALSEGPWDGDEVTDCAGGNTLLGGVLRFLGHDTRLLNSVFEGKGGEFLVPGAHKPGVKAHHFSEVWLGEHYGWQIVDATPEVRAALPLQRPPAPGQQTLLRSVVAPHPATRVVLTVASGDHPSMTLAKGDQGYGFRGRYEDPSGWVYPDHGVAFANPLGLRVSTERAGDGVIVRWERLGPWELLPDATVSVRLERWRGDSRVGAGRVQGTAIPAAQGLLELPRLPDPGEDMHLRAVVALDGDPETGARSEAIVPRDADPR